MKKKLLASLLSLTMMFTMMPTTVYAENDAAAAVQEETTEQELEEAAAEKEMSDAEEPASEVTEAQDETEEQPTEIPAEPASEETEETTETENPEDMETADVVSDEPAEQNADDAEIAVYASEGDFSWGSSENSMDSYGDFDALSAAITSATEPVYVKLNGDITAPDGSLLKVTSGKIVYLDLAGHTLYSEEGRYRNYLVQVYGGKLYLSDSSTEKTGTISAGIVNFVIRVENNGEFTLNGGKVTRSGMGINNNSGLVFVKQGTMTMNDGILTGGNYISNGAVVLNEGGQFIMNGGEIRDNTSTGNSDGSGAGIYMAGTTSFTMNGGSITHNTATNGAGAAINATNATATIAIHGGTISNNSAKRKGGAILFKGTLLLDEEKDTLLMQNNTTSNYGGAICTGFGNQTILMKAGTISGNVASTPYGYGGAVYCQGTFTMTGGQIIENTSMTGAVYVVSNSTFNMTGGKISGNNIETGNNQKGAGLYTNSSSAVNIGGSAEISGNKLATPKAYEEESNIYLSSSSKLLTILKSGDVIDTGLGENITVDTEWTGKAGVHGGKSAGSNWYQVTTNGEKTNVANVVSDNSQYQTVHKDEKLYIFKHVTHTWTKQASGNQITFNCTEPYCSYHTEPLTLTIHAENMEYSGNAYDKATVENHLTDIAGGTISEIIYYTEDGQQTTPVNSGSYKAKVKYDSSSYAQYIEESFEITKATNKWIKEPVVESWIYGDEASTPEGEAKYGSVSVTYAKAGSDEFSSKVPTEAGSYTARFVVEGTDNYSDLLKDVAFTIEARPVTVKVDDKSITYGDAEPEYTSQITDGNLVNGDELELTYSREQGTTAKTYEITAVSANGNYKVTVEQGTLTIQKKDLTIAPVAGQKKVYGDTDPQFQYSVSGLVNEEKAADVLTGALARTEGENKGTYTYEIGSLVDVSGNYNVLLDENAAEFEIAAREVILTWSETNLTYNGSDQSVTATVSNPAFDTDSFTLKYTGNIAADAGTYRAEVTDLGNDNYVLTDNSNQSTDWTIAKANVIYESPEAISGLIYSGEDQALVKATDPVGGTLVYKVDDGEWSEKIPAGLDAGTYRISYKVIGDKNHEDSPEGQITAVIASKSIADAEVKLGAALGYTGDEQTQTVVEVKLDGTVLPADTYEILDATQTEAGVYTLTIRAKENSNYTDSVTCTYVIAPTKAEQITEDEDGNVQIGNGVLSLEVKTEEGAPDTSLGTTKAELIDMLIRNGSITADELSQMADGARLDLILTVKDASATISDEAREQMIQAAGAYQIGQYMDITLFKYMTISGVTGEGQQLHETDGMITISVKVPDNLLNINKGKKRTYCIIRNHNGTAEILSASFDKETQMLTFKTDRFSDYAIAYKDTKKSSGSHRTYRDDDTANTSVTSADTGSTITGLTSPKTGDTAPVVGYVILLIFSLAAAVRLVLMRKKINKN